MMGAWEKLAWTLVMPAFAECVASVWLQDSWFMLRKHDVKLIFLNATGALLEGMFSAWDGGRALPPRGTLGKVLLSLADPMRGGFIAAYTSWAGMVGFAASQGESFIGCLVYLAVTTVVGLLAYGVGGTIAQAVAAPPNVAAYASRSDARKAGTVLAVRGALLAATVGFVASTVSAVKLGLQDYEDETGADMDAPALSAVFEAEWARLAVGMFCAVAGAAVGNFLGAAFEGRLGSEGDAVSRGTLCCNALFCAASLLLPLATLRRVRWGRSVLLTSFAGSFCGAATAFGGWVDDSASRWREGNAKSAAANLGANLGVALVLLLAFTHVEALQALTTLDANKNGVTELGELVAHYAGRLGM